jgi:hypothetical protein
MEKEPNLAALLLKRKGDRSFERVSRDCGGNPSANRLQQIATKPLNEFPTPETIKCLARGLPATVTEITLAAARSLGLNVAIGDPEALTVAGAGNLDAAAQDVILGVARELIKRDEGSSGGTVTDLFHGRATIDDKDRELFERYKRHVAYTETEREDPA